jgi:cell division initiation protein
MPSRLTAMDIESQEFSRKVRGADKHEVRLFLKSVAEEVERLTLQNGELREEIGRLRLEAEEIRSRERTLQETLITAQRMTSELKERSRAEAALVIREARMRAERTLQESQDQLARIDSEQSRSKLERDLFEKRLRSMIEEHLSLLNRRQEERHDLDNVHLLHRSTGSDAG